MTFKNIEKVFSSSTISNPKSRAVFEKYEGKEIEQIIMNDDRLKILFKDGSGMLVYDDGHSCCEHRYMHCEDIRDFDYHEGAFLRHIEVVKGPEIESDEYHETEFCNILTSKGVIQLVCHNEHNGYYGGFDLVIKDY